jgi:hypothetical protein
VPYQSRYRATMHGATALFARTIAIDVAKSVIFEKTH